MWLASHSATVDGFIKPLKSGAGFLKDFII